MRKQFTKMLWLICISAMTSAAWAQPMEPPPGMGRFGGPRREQVRDRIKTIKVWKLTEKLDLTEAQSQRFFPVYNKFFDIRDTIEMQKSQGIQKLDDLTNKENPSESEINKQFNKLDSLDQAIQDAKIKFRNNLKDILSTRQIGQLYVFEVRFMMEMRDIIGDVKQEMRGKRQGRDLND